MEKGEEEEEEEGEKNSVVNDKVDLAAAELCRGIDNLVDGLRLHQVAANGHGLPACLDDAFGHGFGFGDVHVCHHHLCALAGEQDGGFSPDSLARARHYPRLARQ